MADYKVTPPVLLHVSNNFKNIQGKLDDYNNEIKMIARNLPFKIAATEALGIKLGASAVNIASLATKSRSMSVAVADISEKYIATEKAVKNNDIVVEIKEKVGKVFFPEGVFYDIGNLAIILGLPLPMRLSKYYEINQNLKKWFNNLNSDYQSLVISLTEIGAMGGIISAIANGTSLSGSLDFFNGDVKTKGKAVWNLTEGDARAFGGVEGEFHIASASGEISNGIGSLEGEVNVGNVGAKGEVGVTLFDSREFSPQVYAKGEASVSVVEGKVRGSLGTEEFNTYGEAKGSLLSAEASAGVEVGKIVNIDENGRKTISYGVKAEAGAEAYLAEGEVSGGFNILGIDFGVGVTGKAGGAGATVSGDLTNASVSGSVGVGLGLGMEIEIFVDWSNFKWPWQK